MKFIVTFFAMALKYTDVEAQISSHKGKYCAALYYDNPSTLQKLSFVTNSENIYDAIKGTTDKFLKFKDSFGKDVSPKDEMLDSIF